MKAKTILTLIGIAVIAILVTSWLMPGAPDQVQETYLPDHITNVEGATLPRAIREARMRGKRFVRVTDPSNNTINLDIGQPTHSIIALSDPGEIDVFSTLAGEKMPVEKMFNISEGEDGAYTFSLAEVDSTKLASWMYEISVRVFSIASTTEWVIDIE